MGGMFLLRACGGLVVGVIAVMWVHLMGVGIGGTVCASDTLCSTYDGQVLYRMVYLNELVLL